MVIAYAVDLSLASSAARFTILLSSFPRYVIMILGCHDRDDYKVGT